MKVGLLPKRNYDAFVAKQKKVNEILRFLEMTREGPITLTQLLKRPEMTFKALPRINFQVPTEVGEQVEIMIKYAGYIERQEQEVTRSKSMEDKQIPDWLNYATVPSLRKEARLKLETIRPLTIGQASRISGVSPADLSILMVWMRRGPGPDKGLPANEVLSATEVEEGGGSCSAR